MPATVIILLGCLLNLCPGCLENHTRLQVLRKGGAFHCLEFSQLALPGLQELYDAYSFNVIPQIGR